MVEGLGFKIEGLGFEVFRLMVEGLGFNVQGLGMHKKIGPAIYLGYYRD